MMDRKHKLSASDMTGDLNGPTPKKMALEMPSASPNGDLVSDSALDEGLEAFRKEAIWRQMQEYKREFERAANETTSLQAQLRGQEAKAAAVDASWTTLLQDLQSVLPEAASDASSNGIENFLPASAPLDALREALDRRFRQTQQLFVQLSASTPSTSQRGSEVEELRSRCHQLSAETANTRAALAALQSQYERARADLEREHTNLLAAEKRADRFRSRTVQGLEAKVKSAKKEDEEAVRDDKADGQKLAIKSEEAGSKSLPEAPHAVPVDESELIELRQMAARRERDIEELYAGRIDLQKALDGVTLQLANISEAVVQDSAPYKRLASRLQSLEGDLDRARYHSQEAYAQADALREQQNEYRESATKEANIIVEDLNKRCTRYETDLARIRDQREALKGEMAELKARDAEGLQQVEQIRKLANSRQDRIIALGSEVRRLKMHIQAGQCDLAMIEALSMGESEEQVKEYQKRLREAETLAIALRDQLKAYSTTVGNSELAARVASETQVREELIKVKERVLALEHTLATEPGVDPELTQIAKVAEQREERIKVLEATVRSKDLSEEMLMQEVERLATAWQSLDEQNRDKVLQLVSVEEKQLRLTQEKVKADNRYFAAMRSKEGLQQEVAVAQKTIAGQNKAIEVLQQERTSGLSRQTALESEVSLHQRNVRAHQDRISELERDVAGQTSLHNATQSHMAKLQQMLDERTAAAELKASQALRTEEQVSKLKRELDLAKTINKPVVNKMGTDDELRRTNDDLLKMLKCTSCNLRFKTHVITRCFHLLCQECIEGRIANRQRKCPTCAAPFGATDFHAVYF